MSWSEGEGLDSGGVRIYSQLKVRKQVEHAQYDIPESNPESLVTIHTHLTLI